MIANGSKPISKNYSASTGKVEGASRSTAKPPIRAKKSNTLLGKENSLKQNSMSIPLASAIQISNVDEETNSNQAHSSKHH